MNKIDTNKIKEMTNLKISYDIFMREEDLRKYKMKKIMFSFAFCFLAIVGTVSLDALTDNSISNGIKDFFKIKVNGEDYNANCEKTENGTYKCDIKDQLKDGTEVIFEVSDDNINNVNANITDDEINLEINKVIDKVD